MRKVNASIDIQVLPHQIINAFIDPKLLHGWWGVERILIDTQVGGPYVLSWQISEQGFGYVSSGTIREFQRDRILDIHNFVYLNPTRPILGPMSLRIEVKTISEQLSQIDICQDGYQDGPDWDWYYASVVDAWPKALESLKKYLEELV